MEQAGEELIKRRFEINYKKKEKRDEKIQHFMCDSITCHQW